MIALSAHILKGFAVLPKKTVTVNGTDVECIFNLSSHLDNKILGGYEPDKTATIMVKTSLLTNPRSLKGKIVVIDALNWRVYSVAYGEIITTIQLISDDAL